MLELPADLAMRIAAGETQLSMAAHYKVVRQTIARWMQKPEVQAEVAQIQAATIKASKSRLISLQAEAIDVLIKVARDADEPGSTRMSAAIAILDRTGLPKSADLTITGDLAVGVATTESTPDLAERLARRLAGIIPVAGDDEDEGAGSDEG